MPLLAQNLQMLTSPRLLLSYSHLGNQKYDSNANTFGLGQSSLALNLPLYHSNYTKSEYGLKRFLFIGFQPSLVLSSANFENTALDRKLINFSLGFNGIYFSSIKNLYLLSLRPILNEDEYTINNPIWRYNASFMYSRMVNTKFKYRIGLTYTYLFGIVGGTYRFNQKNILLVNLPYNITYRHVINSNLTAGLFLKPNGSMNRFMNRNYFDSSYNTILFRRTSYLLGANIIYKISPKFRLMADLAISSKQQLRFTQDAERDGKSYYEASVKPTYYLSLKLLWMPFAAPKAKKNANTEKENDAEEYLNDDNFLSF
ncbi:MAG: hypothetical protein EBZ58_13150 [Bacteroidetes bacterium]|nr:hypothetical protein [Bacteroidota bacterium]